MQVSWKEEVEDDLSSLNRFRLVANKNPGHGCG